MKDVFVVGTGGLARETSNIIKKLAYDGVIGKFCGFVSADESDVGSELPQGKIIASDSSFSYSKDDTDIVIAIGFPNIKRKVVDRYLLCDGVSFPNIIDTGSYLDCNQVSLGKGNIICRNSFISCDVTVGDFCLINWNVTVGHDVTIGSCSVINPGAHISGYANIGKNVLVGVGACILENIKIGDNSIVGSGAVVTKSFLSDVTVVGIPAKELF